MKKIIIAIIFFALFNSCDDNIEKDVKKRISVIESLDSATFSGYQIFVIRGDVKNPNFAVYRKDEKKEYAVFSISPEIKIEKNFSGDSIDIFFVEEFEKLDCINFQYSQEFIRVDFLHKQGILGKKEKVILFKGDIPKYQNFLLEESIVKELPKGWKYLVIPIK